ncbi:unnamed protein product [Toxocara canis]|uniref:Very-long-chain (3R)-3-hydroxyacyl-CoA dehydratase n=1 Tax=Toxocara canis TaxID=6265 RepID=A0A183V7G7_TOXCA|nr:unnamed protein product [Toxocara canis]
MGYAFGSGLDCSAQRERQRHWRGRNNEKGSRSELNEEGEDGEDNEDDDDDDADSNTSRQFEAKQRKKRGLMGLALGYSRQALGSKLSLISRTSKTTATKWKRSPGLTRKNSIPVPSLNRSPRSASPIDEVTIPIEVNVPPVLVEEPEHESRSSGSLSMKTSAPKSECYMEGNTEVVPNAVEFTNVASSSVSSGNRIHSTTMAYARLYLIAYNAIQVFGWAIIMYKTVMGILGGASYSILYKNVELELQIFQTAAIFEIIHAMVGIVRSPVGTTAMQVFSRVTVVWFVLHKVISRMSKPMFKKGKQILTMK